MTDLGGWGDEAWGDDPWGGGGGITLIGARASRENQVEIALSEAAYWTSLLDAPDASQATLYVVDAVPGTSGLDGTPVREVRVLLAEQVPAAELLPHQPFGSVIRIWLDRPMTPHPARYTVTVGTLFNGDLSETLADGSALEFEAVHKVIVQPQLTMPKPRSDIANPQTLAGARDPVIDPETALLGTFGLDDSRDYAADTGIESYKKRLYRRLVSRPGGFVHLGEGYGLGIKDYGKKLSRPDVRAQLSAEAEKQIAREPETEHVSVVGVQDSKQPGMTRFRIRAKIRGAGTVEFNPGFTGTRK